MKRTAYGRRCVAFIASVALLAALLTYGAAPTFLGLFTTAEGETNLFQLTGPSTSKCPGGVLSYVVGNAHGNVASFPNVREAVLQFRPASTGMTTGRRQTQVDVTVLCNGITPIYDNAVVYFKVIPAVGTTTSTTTTTTTTSTTAPGTTTCMATTPITVPNYVTHVVPSSAFTSSCSAPSLTVQSQTSPSGGATSLFSTEMAGGASSLIFNDDGVNAASGTYTATISVKCSALAACVTTQQIVVGAAPTVSPTPVPTTSTAPTSTPSPMASCPGDYSYSLMLNADGSFTATTSSLAQRATAYGMFCTSGGTITSTVGAPSNGVLTSNSAAGTFSYTPNKAVAGDALDSFDFVLTCSSEATSCKGTAVISIVGADSGEIYYAMDGAITCRGTCDSGAWRTSPSSLQLFDVSSTGVAVTPRKDGRVVDDIDFGFTVGGELLIHAYTTIGNLAARFVTFHPITATEASGYLTSSSVPSGSHVSFEPTCLDKQATTGTASSIWTWTNPTSLTGHLNTVTDAYKSGDNYYQKFGGNHRQCDVYRTNPCKYAPFMTPTLNDDNNNADNNETASVQWKLYVNGCDATWVGKASVESLRALRQPDGSATFTLEEGGTYLAGTVYSQSVKPANWTSPSAGIVHTERAYAVRLKIHNTLVVDAAAQPIASSVLPEAKQLTISADVQYKSGKRKDTNERLYGYSLLLYPAFAVNSTAANITAMSLKVSSMWLLNETWTSPSHVECPYCTGTMISCTGTGKKYETNCGNKALMTFEDIDYAASQFESSGDSNDASNIFASTTVGVRNALNVTFAARANGANSALSADAYPVGSFAMAVKLSNGQVFHVVVNQTDYISELNTRYLDTQMCRPSNYWPVADPLGTSVPVKPYNVTRLAFPSNPTTPETYYGPPKRLTTLETCAEKPYLNRPDVLISSMKATIDDGGKHRNVSMCSVADERTFGVTDWVMLSLPNMQEELKKLTEENLPQTITNNWLVSSSASTVASLQYLVLSVPAAEVSSSLLASASTNGYLNILLDGDAAPAAERTEEEQWMLLGSGGSSAPAMTSYLPWEVYASSLSYRRVGLSANASNTITSEPFNFAFIPGSLVHSSSSIRVQMTVRASIRFSTYATTVANATHASQRVKLAERNSTLLYVVSLSRGISSALRFDLDAYSPATKAEGKIGKKTATSILIILFVAVVCVLAASVYVEFTYKRIIHNAKYHPKRPDSAVGIRYGRDGKPKENQKTAKEGSRAETSAPASTAKARGATSAAGDAAEANVKTKFGTVRGEQTRVKESVAGSSSASSVAGVAGKKADTYKVVNPPIGEEQTRVEDGEVAQF